MSQFDSAQLEFIKPDTWSNIPSVVSSAMKILVAGIQRISQEQRTVVYEFEKIAANVNLSVKSMKQNITDNHGSTVFTINKLKEKLQQQGNELQKKIQDIDIFHTKLHSQNEQKIAEVNETASEISTRQDSMSKIMDTAVNNLEASIDLSKQALKQEINDYIFGPEMERVKKELLSMADGVQAQKDEIYDYLKRTKNRMKEKYKKSKKKLEKEIKQTSEKLGTRVTDLRNIQGMFKDRLVGINNQFQQLQFKLDEIKLDSTIYTNTQMQIANAHSDSLYTKNKAWLHKLQNFLDSADPNDLDFPTQLINMQANLESQLAARTLQLQTEIDEAAADLHLKTVVERAQYVHSELFDIREKLDWLPLDEKEIQKMTPLEARLFTLEMRLRNEERARIYKEGGIEGQMNVIQKNLKSAKELHRIVVKNQRPRTMTPDVMTKPASDITPKNRSEFRPSSVADMTRFDGHTYSTTSDSPLPAPKSQDIPSEQELIKLYKNPSMSKYWSQKEVGVPPATPSAGFLKRHRRLKLGGRVVSRGGEFEKINMTFD